METANDSSLFQIGAPGADVSHIVEKVRLLVAQKTQAGLYTDARVARAERANLTNLRDDQEYMSLYLECLREAVFVDISDFQIIERRTVFSWLFVPAKRLLWKLLKFYTYRLWSQQNQANGLLLGALESMEARHREQSAAWEKRLAALEQRHGDRDSRT